LSEFVEKKYSNFDVLGILCAGDSFGEIALMTEQAKRMATIVSVEETYCFILRREAFNKMMGRYRE
jgi:CRP-like cAMP-binding protein